MAIITSLLLGLTLFSIFTGSVKNLGFRFFLVAVWVTFLVVVVLVYQSVYGKL